MYFSLYGHATYVRYFQSTTEVPTIADNV